MGAPGDELELERLRRALYRSGATDHALNTYLGSGGRSIPGQAVAAETPPDKTTSARRTLLGASVGAIAIAGLVALVFALQPHHQPLVLPTPTVAATANLAAVIAQETGPQIYAQGSATRIEAGQYRYTVVAGDTALGVASRFHVCVADVNRGLPPGVDNGAFPPGTVIAIELDRWQVRADGTVSC